MHPSQPRRFAIPSLVTASLIAIGCDAPIVSEPIEPAVEGRLLGSGGGTEICGLLGGASTSDVPGLDAFLGATSSVQSAAADVQQAVRDELEAMAEGLDVDTSSSTTASELAAAIQAAMIGELAGSVEGIDVVHEAVLCTVDTDPSADLAAACDGAIDAATAVVECLGSCIGDPGATLTCSGDAVLSCSSAAPEASCQGECLGACAESIIEGSCAGTCIGTCDGLCSLPGQDGSCAGACIGTCSGACESVLGPGESCDGECIGDCVSVPDIPSCDDTEVPICEPGVSGVIACDDLCAGATSVPAVAEECATSVIAAANALTECVPPLTEIHMVFSVDVEDDERVELELWSDEMAVHLSALLAAQARAQAIQDTAFGPLGGLLGEVDTLLSSILETVGIFDAGCIVDILDGATAVLPDAEAALQDAIEAVDVIGGLLPAAGA
ncbi:MAG: hypothetical protein H6712_07420 [Myxococcales bacterium]|nr:hypothetical protein [Myxococcales bacterium]MCB9713664.1 hypothetical protein [Myxococcales bacterium]